MHICFLALDYPSSTSGGGVGNQVRTLGRALLARGYRVSVVALLQPGLPEFYDDDGIAVYRVQRGNLHWYISKLPFVGNSLSLATRELEYGWALYEQVRNIHHCCPIDLIETTETGAFWVSLGMRKVRQLVRLHGEQYTFHKYTPDLVVTLGLRLSRALQRVALYRAALLISPSDAHAREIRAELGAACPPIVVIPNSIDLDTMRINVIGIKDPETVLFVGRLERVKGILPLLEAAARVVQEHPDVHFILAGASHPNLSKSEIDMSIQRLGLANHVQLLGHIPWEQLSIWYQRAAVCVLPSYYETFGVAALEPMAFGIPIIATMAGGLPEVVEQGVAGLLVPPGDTQALSKAINTLLCDPSLRQQMGQAGLRRAQSQFSVEKLLAKTLAVYAQSIWKSN
jgi:glycosyltransferase involved in cell wall biosynthesis